MTLRELAGLGLVVGVMSTTLQADVIIKSTGNLKALLGMSGAVTTTRSIKGNKMRTDTVIGNKTVSMIFDLDAQKLYIFDTTKKEADVWDMAAFADEMSKSLEVSGVKGSMKPTGQTKQIVGKTAEGYNLETSITSGVGRSGMSLIAVATGTAWIVKGAPGSEDYARFFTVAAAKGFVLANPAQARSSPSQAKAIVEMYRQFSETGGIAYGLQLEIPPQTPWARPARLASITETVTSVETASLPDDQFKPPTGYKLNTRK